MNRTTLGFLALIVGGAIAPWLGVYPTFLMKCWCFALFACAFNLLLGYAGLLSFGHAAFLGAAGYVAGHSIKVWGWPPEAGIVAGTAFAAALGVPPYAETQNYVRRITDLYWNQAGKSFTQTGAPVHMYRGEDGVLRMTNTE